MELTVAEKLPKPKEIHIPRQISQLIGMGLSQAMAIPVREISQDIEILIQDQEFAKAETNVKLSLKRITDFMTDLQEKELILVEKTPGVYTPEFAKEKDRVKIKPGRQTIDSPLLPQIMDGIFDRVSNPLLVLTDCARKIATSEEENAVRIDRNSKQIDETLKSFRNIEKIEVEITGDNENMQVTLRPIPRAEK